MLDMELEKIFEVDGPVKTAVSLEIDQVGSGPMIVAILTGNCGLAEKCNLLGSANCDIYKYMMAESVDFVRQNLSPGQSPKETEEVLDVLSKSRKLHKAAFMCYLYNQKHLNRLKGFSEVFSAEKKRDLTTPEYELFKFFAVDYDKFIERIFPKLDSQLSLLEEAMVALVEQDTGVEITTLDGCILRYDFSSTETVTRSCWNPITNKRSKFSMNRHCKDQTPASRRRRLAKHKTSFRANVVHSIDGALMRAFILEFFKKTKQRINHLHDCLMVHPNDVDTVFDVIRDVYCCSKMKHLAKDLIFARFKHNSTGKAKAKILAIESDFLSNMGSLDYLSHSTFDSRKHYKFETK